MNIEKEIFKRYKINYDKLLKYGFKKDKDNYIFETILLNDFKAIICIDKKGNISGHIIDTNIDDEYLLYRTEMNGEFVNNIRDEYKKILLDIRNNCFNSRLFISDQANRITNYIKETYSTDPEFLWDDSPGCGVFRNSKTKKWFGIIMNIDYSKLDNKTGEVEVINLKLNEDEILHLIELDGFYKAYHMNKKSWISIVLDDTLNDEIIYTLIDESFELVN